MPQVQWGLSSNERTRGDLPPMIVVNMFVEEAPTEERGLVLQSRSGLDDREESMGDGPVEELFKHDGVLGGALFGLSGGDLYEGSTMLGHVEGDGPFFLAGYENFLFAAAGGGLYGWDGTDFSSITFPDDANVTKVLIGASRAICLRADTGQFYWSQVLGTTVPALNFATAENQPDRLLDCLFIDDVLLLFGAETVEFWPNTQDSELPFQPLEGRVIEKGVRATGCATGFGSTFAWVTNENQVCRGDENTVISSPALEAKIEASATVRLFTFLLEGTEFLALRLDDETHIFGGRAGLWSQFESYVEASGPGNWLPQCFSGGVFGSSTDGRTLAWSSGHEDLGETLERRFRFGFPINAGGVTINNAQIRSNVGQTPYLTGNYTDPYCELRQSRDAGQTWSAWRQAPLGAQGNYRRKVQFRNLGQASQPGFLAEARVTAPVDWRVSDVLVNEPLGGRING